MKTVITTKKSISAAEIKTLKNELELYNNAIGDDPGDDNAYYMKAGVLAKLGHFAESIDCYNQAISLSADNSLYLVDRAKLYIEINNKALAFRDLTRAEQLEKPDGIKGIYVNNIIAELKPLFADVKVDSTIGGRASTASSASSSMDIGQNKPQSKLSSGEAKLSVYGPGGAVVIEKQPDSQIGAGAGQEVATALTGQQSLTEDDS